jgi:hypothetical protein
MLVEFFLAIITFVVSKIKKNTSSIAAVLVMPLLFSSDTELEHRGAMLLFVNDP